MKKIPYSVSADIIRVVAIAGVVMIHTSNSIFARVDFFGGFSWWVAILMDSLSRMSVPLFIMLSGYLLLSKNEGFKESLTRAIKRVGIPLVVWFLIYLLWNDGSPSFINMNLSLFARFFLVNVFHLYFLVIMIGLYIVSPFLRSYLHTASLQSKQYVMYATTAVGVLMTMLQFLFLQPHGGNIFTYWLPYTGLFIAGYVLQPQQKLHKIKLLLMYLLGLCITVGLYYYYYFSLKTNTVSLFSIEYLDNYMNLFVLAMTFPVFLFLMHHKFTRLGRWKNVIHSIARASFGIYLIHLIVVKIFQVTIPLYTYVKPLWLFVFVNWFVVFLVSYLLTLGLMKIPRVRVIIGEKA